MSTDPAALRAAIDRRVWRHTAASGGVAFLALPSRVDEYLEHLTATFAQLRRPFARADRSKLRAALLERLTSGFALSPLSFVQVDYNTDDQKADVIHWKIETFVLPAEASYDPEGHVERPPLLGSTPDARLVSLARELGAPADVTFLDVGAAMGRNALALARLGHPTDAVEPLAKIADALADRARSESLPVRVVRGDFWDRAFALPRPRYRLVAFTEIATRLRGLTPVRDLLRRLGRVLEPGGAALLGVFVARDGYLPDAGARELGEAMGCPFYTREELESAAFGTDVHLGSDESAIAYEQAHQPGWPPAPWYAAWASGKHVFDLPEDPPPIELRWLVYRRA